MLYQITKISGRRPHTYRRLMPQGALGLMAQDKTVTLALTGLNAKSKDMYINVSSTIILNRVFV